MGSERREWKIEKGVGWEASLERDWRMMRGGTKRSFFVRASTFSGISVSCGYLFKEDAAVKGIIEKSGVQVWKRLTGGKIAFHGNDLIFSVHVRTDLLRTVFPEIPALFCETLRECLKREGVDTSRPEGKREEAKVLYCFQSKNDYDIFFGEWKLVGYAGRVRKEISFFQFQCGTYGWSEREIKKIVGEAPSYPPGEYGEILSLMKRDDFIDSFLSRFTGSLFFAEEGGFSCRRGVMS